MSREIRTQTPCPQDDVLLCWMDEALEGEEHARVEEHLQACPACQGRVRALERRRAEVRGWLHRHDPPSPPRSQYQLTPRRRFRRPGPKWALAASIVVAVGVAAGPARGWLLDRLGWTVTAPMAPGVDTASVDAAATAFVPRGVEVTVVFEGGVAGRSLVLFQAADSMVTFDAPALGGEVLVRPSGIEVHGGEDGAVYRLSLPASVIRVRVRVEGAGEILVEPAADGAEHTVVIPGGPPPQK